MQTAYDQLEKLPEKADFYSFRSILSNFLTTYNKNGLIESMPMIFFPDQKHLEPILNSDDEYDDGCHSPTIL